MIAFSHPKAWQDFCRNAFFHAISGEPRTFSPKIHGIQFAAFRAARSIAEAVMDPLDICSADILIVDDNLNNVRLLKNLLENANLKTRATTNGELALRSLKIKKPDLILLDIKMPLIDGFEVCRRIKSMEGGRRIPIIFISSLGDTMDKVKAFNAGAIDYIESPFQEEEVLARVKTHLKTMLYHRELEAKNIELENTKVDMEKAMKTSASFLANMNHEMRTPLNGIINGCVVILDGYEEGLPADVMNFLDIIRKSGSRLLEFCNNTLRLTNLHGGNEKLDQKCWSLREVLTSPIEGLKAENQEKHLIVENIWPCDDIQCMLDVTLIQEALTKIFENAFKFSSPGGRIAIELSRDEEHAVISITDSGPGIDETELELVFKSFYQGKLTDDGSGGCGIGLTIAREIIWLHKGSITLENQSEGGLKATVFLPLSASQARVEKQHPTRDHRVV